MNAKQLKTRYLERKSQVVVLDAQGVCQESCDTLLPLRTLSGSLYEHIPLLESVRDTWLQLASEESFQLPCVQLDVLGKTGYYDCTFTKTDAVGRSQLVWLLWDFTEAYRHLLDVQQERNEADIRSEFAALAQKNLLLEKQLLLSQRNELERTQRLKTDFFSQISHEIRTPVNGIVGLSNLLLTHPHHRKNVSYLQALHGAARHLGALVNDVLEFSKIEAGRITFEAIPFRLSETLQAVVHAFTFICQEKHLSLTLTTEPEVPAQLVGDPLKLSQILYNLVGNAVKFTHRGGIVVNVSLLEATSQIGRLRFTVQDTGIGIAREKLSRIFNPYEQAELSSARLYGGTGLGLSIVKQLTELQGGTVAVTSTEDQGTTFRVELPFGLINLSDATTRVPVSPSPSRRILIADDNALNRKILRELLNSWGHSVTLVTNGRTVLKKLRTMTVDLVILDYQMPELDGYETIQAIRDARNEVPVVLLTAGVTPQVREKFASYGVRHFLDKPFDPAVLRRIIDQPRGSALADTQAHSLNYLHRITDGNVRLMTEILDLFLEQAPGDLTRMQQLCTQGDWPALGKVMHKFRSSCRYVGIEETESLLNSLEADLHGSVDSSVCTQRIGELSHLVTLATERLTIKRLEWVSQTDSRYS